MRNGTRKLPELLAPAGSRKAFLGALAAGADAVYLGGEKFGARAYAENFTQEDIVRSIREAHLYGRKVYLTLNVLTKENELKDTVDFAVTLYRAGLDGVIVQDLGVLDTLRRECPGLDLHASHDQAGGAYRRGVFYPRRYVLFLFGTVPVVQLSGRQERKPRKVRRNMPAPLQGH